MATTRVVQVPPRVARRRWRTQRESNVAATDVQDLRRQQLLAFGPARARPVLWPRHRLPGGDRRERGREDPQRRARGERRPVHRDHRSLASSLSIPSSSLDIRRDSAGHRTDHADDAERSLPAKLLFQCYCSGIELILYMPMKHWLALAEARWSF